MLQGAESVVLELIKSIGAPAATAMGFIWLHYRFIAPRHKNGSITPEALQQAIADGVAEALAASRKDTTQHLDLALTQNFHWLLRDLEAKIGREHAETRKDWTNALQRFMFDLELFVLRGQPPERRPRE